MISWFPLNLRISMSRSHSHLFEWLMQQLRGRHIQPCALRDFPYLAFPEGHGLGLGTERKRCVFYAWNTSGWSCWGTMMMMMMIMWRWWRGRSVELKNDPSWTPVFKNDWCLDVDGDATISVVTRTFEPKLSKVQPLCGLAVSSWWSLWAGRATELNFSDLGTS